MTFKMMAILILSTTSLSNHDEDLNFSTITRLIWFNNLGKFKRVRIYEVTTQSAVIEHAKRMTAERYIPKQIYYPFINLVHAYPLRGCSNLKNGSDKSPINYPVSDFLEQRRVLSNNR